MTNPASQSQGKAGYLPTLDGWRAVGIALVLFAHDQIRIFGPFSTSWAHYNNRRGVDLFFGLSGLLICTKLLQEEQISGFINLRSFYIRRLFRIQPAALTYLGVVSLLMFCGILYKAYSGVFYSLTFVRNYLPLRGVATDWYTGHFWSLSVEEHFYLLLPCFLVCVRKRRVAVLTILVVLVEVWKKIVFHYPSLVFGWYTTARTDMAIDGILLASLGAILLSRPRVRGWCRSWLNPYVMISFLIFGFWAIGHGSNRSRTSTEFGLLCLYPLAMASTMLHPATLVSRLLETPPLRLLGRISYSLYLWQMLFFPLVFTVPSPHPSLLMTIQHSWLRYPSLLVAALLSYYFIEKPFIRIGHMLAYRPRLEPPTEISAKAIDD